MKEFELYEPESIEEAASLLAKFGGRGRILAGGTDLLVELKRGRLNLAAVINLKKIKGMNTIRFQQEGGLAHRGHGHLDPAAGVQTRARHYPC